MKTIKIEPKSPRTKWVALSLYDKEKILVEGVKPEVVVRKADKLVGRENYTMQFIIKETWIL